MKLKRVRPGYYEGPNGYVIRRVKMFHMNFSGMKPFPNYYRWIIYRPGPFPNSGLKVVTDSPKTLKEARAKLAEILSTLVEILR